MNPGAGGKCLGIFETGPEAKLVSVADGSDSGGECQSGLLDG